MVAEREALLGMHLNRAKAELTVTFHANAENHSTWISAKQLLSANEVSPAGSSEIVWVRLQEKFEKGYGTSAALPRRVDFGSGEEETSTGRNQ